MDCPPVGRATTWHRIERGTGPHDEPRRRRDQRGRTSGRAMDGSASAQRVRRTDCGRRRDAPAGAPARGRGKRLATRHPAGRTPAVLPAPQGHNVCYAAPANGDLEVAARNAALCPRGAGPLSLVACYSLHGARGREVRGGRGDELIPLALGQGRQRAIHPTGAIGTYGFLTTDESRSLSRSKEFPESTNLWHQLESVPEHDVPQDRVAVGRAVVPWLRV